MENEQTLAQLEAAKQALRAQREQEERALERALKEVAEAKKDTPKITFAFDGKRTNLGDSISITSAQLTAMSAQPSISELGQQLLEQNFQPRDGCTCDACNEVRRARGLPEVKAEEPPAKTLDTFDGYCCGYCEEYYPKGEWERLEVWEVVNRNLDVDGDECDDYIYVEAEPTAMDAWRCSRGCFHHYESKPYETTFYLCPECELYYENEEEARSCCK